MLGVKHERVRHGDNCRIRRLRFDGEANRLANFSVLASKPGIVIQMPDLSVRICPFPLELRTELWRGDLQNNICWLGDQSKCHRHSYQNTDKSDHYPNRSVT